MPKNIETDYFRKRKDFTVFDAFLINSSTHIYIFLITNKALFLRIKLNTNICSANFYYLCFSYVFTVSTVEFEHCFN